MSTMPAGAESSDTQKLVQYVDKCYKESKDSSGDRRRAWDELWAIYQNQQDWSKKATWQSKVFAPKLWMKIERAASEVKRALMDVDRLFKFVPDDTADDPEMVEKWLEETKLEQRFKSKLAQSNLAQVYPEATKESFITGIGSPKPLWDSEDGLIYEAPECANVYYPPDWKHTSNKPPKYVIEVQEMDLDELMRRAKATNEAAGEKIWDLDVVEAIEEDFKSSEKVEKEKLRKGIAQYTPSSKRVELRQFWGDVIEDEDETERNQLIIVANGKYIVRHQDNPFDHQMPPYVPTVPINYPHRGFCGISLVEACARLQYGYNNLLNMVLDNLNFTVNKVFEFNSAAVKSPANLMSIFPGKMIPTTSGEQVVREVMTSQVGSDAIRLLQVLSQEIDEGTAVTEFMTGSPGDKAKTLGEIELKTAMSKGLFDVIARTLEQNSIRKLLEMSYSLCVQYDGFPDIEGKARIQVGGLSLALLQKEKLERVQQVLAMALQAPPLTQMTDIPDLWQKLLGLLDLGDCYKEPMMQGAPGEPMAGPGGVQDVQAKAAMDAKATVARMTPEQIQQAAGQLRG